MPSIVTPPSPADRAGLFNPVLLRPRAPPSHPASHCCRRRWTCAAASFHRRPTTPLSSLGHVATPQVTHCHPCALPSPESVRPRVRRRGLVAAARRSSPQPLHRHQLARGEPNRTPVPHVALVRPHITADELPRRRRGLVVKSRGYVWIKDLSVMKVI
jgi:hypothetical protein